LGGGSVQRGLSDAGQLSCHRQTSLRRPINAIRYWNQPTHTLGTAFAINGLSPEAQAYFAAGGIGILVGDGQLPHYAREQILETYYTVNLNKALTVTGDYQYIRNPAYNVDRGPVSIWGLRLHAEF